MLAARQLTLEISQRSRRRTNLSPASPPTSSRTSATTCTSTAMKPLRLMAKTGKPTFTSAENAVTGATTRSISTATKFIPTWVKVAVALALGMGTMVGWKRIVVTVGEKIGKDHLTYAQGASAEIVAAITIIAADQLHCPSPPPTSSPPAWPEPWSPTAAACNCPPSATSPWPGSSPFRLRRCSRPVSSGLLRQFI